MTTSTVNGRLNWVLCEDFLQELAFRQIFIATITASAAVVASETHGSIMMAGVFALARFQN